MIPFFSIVIPCYNSRKYLTKNLQAIVDCGMEDIQVILADDCSTESYQDVVDSFSDKLNIIQCKTEHNSGNPSNGRELGASNAIGKYLTFVDHDDYVSSEGIKELRKFIEENNEPEYLVAGIRQVDDEGNIEVEKFEILPFLHGKFFNREKFYVKCDLHHRKDIKYQEDNYFTAMLACELIKNNLEPTFLNFCTHCWHNNDQSLGHKMLERKKTDKEVNLEMFKTNIMITTDVMFKYFDEGSLPEFVATEWLIREVISFYFDTQMFFQFFSDYKVLLQPVLLGIKQRLNLNNDAIMRYALSENARMLQDEYNNVLQFFPEGVQPSLRLEEFLEEVDPDGSTNLE